MDTAALQAIDTKLTALLAVVLDDHLLATGSPGSRRRSIDRLLADAGLSTAEIAALLGKTQRGVQKALEGGTRRRAQAAKQPTSRARKAAKRPARKSTR